MARKKVTLAYIADEKKRNTSFVKRKKGLLNKIKEISTLCNVDACAIIYGQHDIEPDLWPSMEGVYKVLARFYSLSEKERTHKMVNHETFTKMRTNKMRNKLDRLRRENKLIGAEGFVYQCRAGAASLDLFNMRDRDEMGFVIDQILTDLTSRIDSLSITRGGDGMGASPPVDPAQVDMVDEEIISWDNMLSELQNPIEPAGHVKGNSELK